MSNAETTSAVIKVTDDTFQDLVLSSSFSKPVLVDFWAQWCPPCHMLSPVLDEIAAELSDTLTVAKMDVDENQVTAQRYGSSRCQRSASSGTARSSLRSSAPARSAACSPISARCCSRAREEPRVRSGRKIA